ncbi:hypothetical protein FB567DRAFT_516824 [Paraphoma chrysanthemicola]|uniref:Uncharacterized protein n=1 Tax=Paraphoma chrysanthemicola TaxID=798071 RepID=A0A8K0RGB6_9PLEO|nr:hypothetical protein FB567DRAFT_516824 [Paraphoma chrysanthemicola]
MIPTVFSSPLPIANQQAQQLQTPPTSAPPPSSSQPTQNQTSSTSSSSFSRPQASAVRTQTPHSRHIPAAMLTIKPVTSAPTSAWAPWLDPALQNSTTQAEMQAAGSYMHVPVSQTEEAPEGAYMHMPVSQSTTTGSEYAYITGAPGAGSTSRVGMGAGDPGRNGESQEQRYFAGNGYFPPTTQGTPVSNMDGLGHVGAMPPGTEPTQENHMPHTTRY